MYFLMHSLGGFFSIITNDESDKHIIYTLYTNLQLFSLLLNLKEIKFLNKFYYIPSNGFELNCT
jgi:hypothetical protein